MRVPRAGARRNALGADNVALVQQLVDAMLLDQQTPRHRLLR